MSPHTSRLGVQRPRVVGIDACKQGWIGVTNDLRGYFGANITEVLAVILDEGDLDVVAIDIPIGLPVNGSRQADSLARRLVGGRASSVFSTPVRAALGAPSHAEATAISVQSTGKGISQQAYALRKKILEVDSWARIASQPVIEVHPEVCFAVMNGEALRHPKSSWAGFEQRRRILAKSGFCLPSDLGTAGELAATDDVLDAAAAAWTAARFAQGTAVSYPSTPENFGDGHEAAIWA
ncbi:DUF429 domain-containing protein [Janibacter alittae]|uniref:DUF429 domain-containing protein n=1 Tax=Janibacter alittae TaxID=3115209 RepID=A0ABZ2MHN4_9MICO